MRQSFALRFSLLIILIFSQTISALAATDSGYLRLKLYDPSEQRSYQLYAAYALDAPLSSDPVRSAWVTGDPTLFRLPIEPGITYTVWGAINVPGFRRVLLELDNDGRGYAPAAGQTLFLNFSYEVARTELRKLQERLEGGLVKGYSFSDAIPQAIASAGTSLAEAGASQAKGDPGTASRLSYEILGLIIPIKEQLTLEIAHQDIQAVRQHTTSITIRDEAGAPLPGLQVDYQQVRQDFNLAGGWPPTAVWQGEPNGWKITESAAYYRDIARETGFEMGVLSSLTWGVVARGGITDLRFDDDMTIRNLNQEGFQVTGSALWFSDYFPGVYPTEVNSLEPDRLIEAATDFVSTLVGHYRGEVALWNLYNEPNYANGVGLNQAQSLELMDRVIDAARVADPETLAGINLGFPGFERTAPNEYDDNDPLALASFDLAKLMQAAGIQPDFIGLQLYYGAYGPPIDLGTLSDLFDEWERTFDYKYFIEEFEYPSHAGYREFSTGEIYFPWGQEGYTSDYQAYWGAGVYTLAMSKPDFIGVTWLLGCDQPKEFDSRRLGDGLFEQDCLTPRPLMGSLKDLFDSWRTSGTALTDASGQIRIDGFSGDYQLTVTDASQTYLQQTVHTGDGEQEIALEFSASALTTANAQAAYTAIQILGRNLSLMETAGRTAGIPAARDAQAQANRALEQQTYRDALEFAGAGRTAISFQMDGHALEWDGIPPVTNSFIQDQQYVERITFTADSNNLYILIVPRPGQPAMEYQFHMRVSWLDRPDAGNYSLQTYPWFGLYSRDEVSAFTNGIRDYEITYGQVVEIRLPLATLEYPDTIDFDSYAVGLDETGFGYFGAYRMSLPEQIPVATITPAITITPKAAIPAATEAAGATRFDPGTLSIVIISLIGGTLLITGFIILRRGARDRKSSRH